MEFGVMQGRLTEKGGFYPQIFPWLEWEDEFYQAKELGLTHIEWMLNADRLPDNPILSPQGRARIRELEVETGVQVRSLCMNFVMQYSLRKKETFEAAVRCLHQLGELQHLRTVIIPLEGASSPEFYPDEALKKDLLKLGETSGQIHCLIESNRIAEEQLALIEPCSDTVSVCYDVGNAAGLGQDVLMELNVLMEHVGEIHLKDKKNDESLFCGGLKSIYLGEGVVDFEGLFRWLKESGYHGNLVLESYFDKALADLQRNLSYLRSL